MSIQEYIHQNLVRLSDQLTIPAVPIMSQEDFDALPKIDKMILTCNVIGCGRMVSTHGMLCVEHHTGQEAIEQAPRKGEEHLPRKYVRFLALAEVIAPQYENSVFPCSSMVVASGC